MTRGSLLRTVFKKFILILMCLFRVRIKERFPSHLRPQREISFSPQTSYTQLLDIYSEEYKNGEDQYEYRGAGNDLGDNLPNDDPDDPEGIAFYDDLDSVGWENLENQMEG
ncbi:hypothetical protein SLE2022_311100 [Rubroshorea leprosula]